MEPFAWRALVAAGFLIGQGALLFTYYDTQNNTKQIEAIRLSRDLTGEFFVKDGVYKEMRNAVESCEKLYKSWGGRFTHDEINRYLGFFEDLGYYYRKGFLDIELISHSFGAYIIEAWEYPEIQRYVTGLRTNAKQPDSFKELERLATDLKKEVQFSALARDAKSWCDQAAAKTAE